MAPGGARWPWNDALRSLDVLGSVWSSTALPAVSSGAGVAYRTLLTTLQRLLVGNEITAQLGGDVVTLTVTDFEPTLQPGGLSVGQLGDIRIAAHDMRWGEHRLDDAIATLHNVHFRPGVPPILVAAPVDLSVELPAEAVTELVQDAAPDLIVEIRDDATAYLRWARRPQMGTLVADVEVARSSIWLKPRAVVVKGKRLRLPARTPDYPLGLPDLPRGFLITDVRLGPGSLHVTGLLPEWRMELPLTRLEDIITRLSEGGLLNLSWPTLRRGTD
jgi:hypothetical protein